MRVRLLPIACLALLALGLAACGGGGSGTDPASVAPPDTSLYLEVTARPDAETAESVDALAGSIAGIDDLGGYIVAELESDDDGDPVDFETEVEPWLGERAALAFGTYRGEGFEDYVIAIQSSDDDAAREFVSTRTDAKGAEEATYEGTEFAIEPDDGTALGVIDGLLVMAEDREGFERAVDTAAGDSLVDSDEFSDAVGSAPSDSVADLYVDLGGLIESSEATIEPDAQVFIETLGIEPGEATAVASLIPGEERIELDVSTSGTGENPTEGDAAELLGSVPATAVAALSTPGFGARLGEAVDRIDANGIDETVPPNQLEDGLRQAGIDLEALAASLGDMALFVEGRDASSIAAAMVVETSGEDAKRLIDSLGRLLRSAGVDGISAVGSGFSGFSIRNADLGAKPLIVATRGDRMTIAYGLEAAKAALDGGAPTLAEDPGFEAAAEALGDTPISTYVQGPEALALVADLVGPGDEDFESARPFLEKVAYVAAGTGADGDRSTAKIVIGVAE